MEEIFNIIIYNGFAFNWRLLEWFKNNTLLETLNWNLLKFSGNPKWYFQNYTSQCKT